MALQIQTPAFNHEAPIPTQYTCDGADRSPALAWSGHPKGVKTYALICDDPDTPVGTWVHWVIYNIPPTVTALAEGFPTDAKLKDGTLQGINDFKKTGYGGPCPPPGHGVHRYFFKLYALDTKLPLESGATKAQLEKAMKGRILEQAVVMGRYERK